MQGRTQPTFAQVAATALEPGYARSRSRSHRRGRARRGAFGRLAMPLTLALAALLTVVVVRQQVTSAPARDRLRAGLGTVHGTRSADRVELAGQVGELRSAIGDLRERQRTTDELWATATERAGTLAAPAGLIASRGPGVRMTLAEQATTPAADAGNPRPAVPRPVGSRIADHDLADVVNLLWSAGAEAVAVNGIRLTSLSAVREAGDAILVSLTPVTSPYVVEAIGDPGTIAARVASSPVTTGLLTRAGAPPNAVSVIQLDELTLPAAEPGPKLRYARGSGS